MPPKLDLPTLQNWSCHNCGGCCRQHEIEITAEERQRIEQQGWQADQLAGHAGPVVESLPARGGVARWRLAHRSDGACVFLDERGLCRIHARFGEPAKPLACRVYPFAFHPAGDRVVLGFRFSCPSVVSNRGATPAAQRGDLTALYDLVVPNNAGTIAAPAFRPGLALSWNDVRELGGELDRLLTRPAVPLPLRLLWCLGTLDLLNARSDQELAGARWRPAVAEAASAVIAELPEMPPTLLSPTGMARRMFRLLVAQYARRDTFAEVSAGWRYRWRLFRSIVRFTWGAGKIPVLQAGFESVPFAVVERPFGPWPAPADELLTRYLRVKIESLHYCGRACYDLPVRQGFANLALAVAATCYLARWLAAGAGRREWNAEDFERALAAVDHHHAYSPALALPDFQQRQRWLLNQREVTRLVAWYGR